MNPTNRATNRAVVLFLWAALYFCSGYISHKLNGPFSATGYIWLPAGVTVAAFMLTPMPRWLAVGLAFFAAQMLLGWVEGRDTLRLILFSLDEIGSAALAVALVRRTHFSLEGLAFVRGLLIAGVVSSAVSAAIGAGWFTIMQDVPFWRTARVGRRRPGGRADRHAGTGGLVAFRAMRSGGMSGGDFLFGLGAFAALVLTTFFIFDREILAPVPERRALCADLYPVVLCRGGDAAVGRPGRFGGGGDPGALRAGQYRPGRWPVRGKRGSPRPLPARSPALPGRGGVAHAPDQHAAHQPGAIARAIRTAPERCQAGPGGQQPAGLLPGPAQRHAALERRRGTHAGGTRRHLRQPRRRAGPRAP
ncbi:hypothetical protein ACU4GD_40585 [Cupriavidus basilensis]